VGDARGAAGRVGHVSALVSGNRRR
jgi:hypothetical protein